MQQSSHVGSAAIYQAKVAEMNICSSANLYSFCLTKQLQQQPSISKAKCGFYFNIMLSKRRLCSRLDCCPLSSCFCCRMSSLVSSAQGSMQQKAQGGGGCFLLPFVAFQPRGESSSHQWGCCHSCCQSIRDAIKDGVGEGNKGICEDWSAPISILKPSPDKETAIIGILTWGLNRLLPPFCFSMKSCLSIYLYTTPLTLFIYLAKESAKPFLYNPIVPIQSREPYLGARTANGCIPHHGTVTTKLVLFQILHTMT